MIPALGRKRQEDCQCEANLGHLVKLPPPPPFQNPKLAGRDAARGGALAYHVQGPGFLYRCDHSFRTGYQRAPVLSGCQTFETMYTKKLKPTPHPMLGEKKVLERHCRQLWQLVRAVCA